MNNLDQIIQDIDEKLKLNRLNPELINYHTFLINLKNLEPDQFYEAVNASDLPTLLKYKLIKKNTLILEQYKYDIPMSIEYIKSMEEFIEHGFFSINMSWEKLVENATIFYLTLREYCLGLLKDGVLLDNLSAEHITDKFGPKGGYLDYITSAYNNLTNVSAKENDAYYKKAEANLCKLPDAPFRNILIKKLHKEYGTYGNIPQINSQFYSQYIKVTKFPEKYKHYENRYKELITNNYKNTIISENNTALFIKANSKKNESVSNKLIHNIDTQSIKDILIENQKIINLDIKNLATMINNKLLEFQTNLLNNITESMPGIDVEELKTYINSTIKIADNSVPITEIKVIFEKLLDKINVTYNLVEKFINNHFDAAKITRLLTENLKESKINFLTNSGNFLTEFKEKIIQQLEKFGEDIDNNLGAKLVKNHKVAEELNQNILKLNYSLSNSSNFNWIKAILIGGISGITLFIVSSLALYKYKTISIEEIMQSKSDTQTLNKIYAQINKIQDKNTQSTVIKLLNLNPENTSQE